MSKLNSTIIFFLFLFLSCKNLSLEPVPKFHSVKYKVTGTARSVSIEWINKWGNDSFRLEVSLPWSYEYPTKRISGTAVYLSATNRESDGTVIAIIYRDNLIFMSDTSYNAYGTATASGTL